MKRVLATLLLAVFAGQAPAVELGEDGLHKPDWLRLTFKDVREDMEAAQAEGKRMVIIYEQRGCIYCTEMHQNVFPDPQIDALIRDEFYFVQMNLFGDVEVTDLDGTILSEKQMAKRWGVFFTPTMIFLPEEVPEGGTVTEAAVAVMPGAFERGTTLHLMQWVLEKGYETDEHFQAYHGRKAREEQVAFREKQREGV